MKPPRGKRVDPQSRPAEFSSEGGRAQPARRSDWTLPARDACRPCALSAGRAPRPVLGRSEGGEEGRWAPRGAYCYSLACPDPLWGPRSRRRRRPPRSPWMFRLAETGQPCLPTASLDGLGWARWHRVGGESVGPPPDPS